MNSALPGIDQIIYQALVLVFSLYPIWLPLMLGALMMELWFHYIREKFIAKEGSVLLEIKLPKELTKTPHAMEIFLSSIWQKGSVTWIDSYFNGKVRPWFSLEIASIEGRVHFYIWAFPKYRDLIEAHLYGQFPGIEVGEADDYTKKVYFDRKKMAMWGCYYDLALPDAYPIKTYVDFGLDNTQTEEENKVDPITSLLEFMGSMGKGEQLWFQTVIQAHRKVDIKDGRLITVPEWRAEAKAEIKKIRESAVIKVGENSFSQPTKLQQDTIASIERHLTKWPFEVCMRGLYVCEASMASKIGIRAAGIIGAYRAFSGNYEVGFNSFKLGPWTDFDYPWQDFSRIRRTERERKFLDAFKKRSFFQPPYKHWLMKERILTTEEIATIYHFPGAVAQTPNLERIQSKKTQAPTNLPI